MHLCPRSFNRKPSAVDGNQALQLGKPKPLRPSPRFRVPSSGGFRSRGTQIDREWHVPVSGRVDRRHRVQESGRAQYLRRCGGGQWHPADSQPAAPVPIQLASPTPDSAGRSRHAGREWHLQRWLGRRRRLPPGRPRPTSRRSPGGQVTRVWRRDRSRSRRRSALSDTMELRLAPHVLVIYENIEPQIVQFFDRRRPATRRLLRVISMASAPRRGRRRRRRDLRDHPPAPSSCTRSPSRATSRRSGSSPARR